MTDSERVDSMPFVMVDGVKYRYSRVPYEKLRWDGMVRNMTHDPGMTRELGMSLLSKARKLPVGPHMRLDELERAYAERFGQEDIAPSRSSNSRWNDD